MSTDAMYNTSFIVWDCAILTWSSKWKTTSDQTTYIHTLRKEKTIHVHNTSVRAYIEGNQAYDDWNTRRENIKRKPDYTTDMQTSWTFYIHQ